MKDLADFLAQMPNPMARAVVSEHDVYQWSAEVPDVESIHREARLALLGAARRAREGRPRLLLVRGEGGDGKSHLLAWLRRQEAEGFRLCAVPPMPEAGEPFRHALRHLVAALRRPAPELSREAAPLSGSAATPPVAEDDGGGLLDTPLARLLWSVLYAQACDLLDSARLGAYDGPQAMPRLLLPLCEEGGRPRGAAAFARRAGRLWAQIEPGLDRYLQSLPSEEPVDLALRAVLCQYPYADRRDLCVAWLAGEDLGEAELARLRVPEALATEAAARRVLTALCRGAPRPLLLCYDEIEGMIERLREPGLQALCDVVVEVARAGGRAGQIIACHASVWDALLGKLSRLMPGAYDEVKLERITSEQARDLVLARLEAAFSQPEAPPRPDPAYPFREAEILGAVSAAGLRNARAALRHFEAEFERRRDQLVQPGQAVNASALPPPTTEGGVVVEALGRAAIEVRRGLGDSLPGGRAAQLRAVVRELCEGLQKQPRGYAGVQVTGCDPILGGGLRLSVQVGGRTVRAAIEVSNADAGPALFGAATRLQRQVSDGRAELALLLREQGLSLWAGVAKAGAIEAQLGPLGGVLWLSEDEAVELLAVERVLHAASARELSAGPRAIGRPEALGQLLGRPEGPPELLRRLLGRLRQIGSSEEREGAGATASAGSPPRPASGASGAPGRPRTPAPRPTGPLSQVPGKPTGPLSQVASKPTGQLSPIAEKPTGQLAQIANKPTGQLSQVPGKPTGPLSPVASKPTGQLSQVPGRPTGPLSPVASKPTGQLSRVPGRPTGPLSQVASKPTGQLSQVPGKPTGPLSPVASKPTGQLSAVASKPTGPVSAVASKPTGPLSPVAPSPARPASGPRTTHPGVGATTEGPGGAPRPVIRSTPPRPPEPAPAARPTLARPAVPISGPALTAQQVLAAIGSRSAVEERTLARELGLPEEALPALLQPLEQDGALRVAVQGGVRVVLRDDLP